MIEDVAQPGQQELTRIQAEATAANRRLLIERSDGRVFTIADDAAQCRPDVAEFTDDHGNHVALPYAEICRRRDRRG